MERVADQGPNPTLQNPIGTNLECLDDYDDEIESPPISTSDSRHYPSRAHRPSIRFGNYVKQWMGHLLERGNIVAVMNYKLYSVVCKIYFIYFM